MGKASKQKKNRVLTATGEPYTTPTKPLPSPPVSGDDTTEIDPVDLEITIETLTKLAGNPAILKTPTHKSTRQLINKIHFALGGSAGTPVEEDGGDKLINALRTRDHHRARALLTLVKTPKLGALQRWVRECDAANVASLENASLSKEEHEAQQNETWKTLECIIRTTTPEIRFTAAKNPLQRFEPWAYQRKTEEEKIQTWKLVQQHKLCTPADAAVYKQNFRILHTIPGPARLPPNAHPALIWTSVPGTIRWDGAQQVTAHPVPNIPGCTLLHNVIPQSTCTAIVAAAETLGFTPDAPVSGSATQLSSILAHNFYWMADELFNNTLMERVRPHLPSTLNGGALRTLNRRYRCYRYVPGAVYRPHVDGAWPPSGIDPKTGAYVYDASDGTQYSRFTFLIYLNDEFEGGETTFFVPDVAASEGLEARPVRPLQGSVLVFPHGDTQGSLVHEGTGVKAGAKYIIRTDVVYDVEKGGRAKQNV